MKKFTVFLVGLLLLLPMAGLAGATMMEAYEYYEGAQKVGPGDAFVFKFDLVLPNDAEFNQFTNSNLDLAHDAAIGFENTPVQEAYFNINLWAKDEKPEKVRVRLTAFYEDYNTKTTLYNGFFNGYGPSNQWVNLSGAILDPNFLQDPFGKIRIKAEILDGFTNNFFIREVGIGVKYSVPEPATMLLLGSGLIGLMVTRRKRFIK